ncbi:hypothetical protein SAMN05444339_10229 [Loktanella atrilutea]|uniref:Uncharacterized protein n=1 Tax=Loktanella atrilutea TaxID=366533 RepID=A0A1M4W8N6_LOKAT|nr:hypothetical protein [Loktanella atrilutea]SHE77621.1 hypothetical protein SAMN05444339_10229 [Loktanella atrilutea]
MTDRPIAFSPAVMTALLREIAAPGTGKTQTRRVLRAADPSEDLAEGYRDVSPPYVAYGGACWEDDQTGAVYRFARSPGVGDRLWVREAWTTREGLDKTPPRDISPDQSIGYLVDGKGPWLGKYRPPMFMPRWASRITLTVTDVRVQRVQEISPEDAAAEGVDRRSRKVRQFWLFGADQERRDRLYLDACKWEFEELWDSLNESRGFGWQANPWVVAVTFTPAMGNIDQVELAS